MLKGIPGIISPELLKILMEMGHGDEIVIGDGNFPAQSLNERCVRCDGHGVVEVLEAILKLMPLDTFEAPVHLMEKVKGQEVPTPIWDEFASVLAEHTDEPPVHIDRYDFYEKTRNAYAVVTTTEMSLYACIILKKGIVKE